MKTPLLLVAAAILVVILIVITFRDELGQMAERQHCRSQLYVIAAAVALYRDDHQGEFPTNILSADGSLSKLLTCPGIGESAKSNGADGDYVYVDWSKLIITNPLDFGLFPLAYDRSLSNHGGKGINIVLVNTVSFWDRNAEWLKHFAQTHPDYNIVVPQSNP